MNTKCGRVKVDSKTNYATWSLLKLCFGAELMKQYIQTKETDKIEAQDVYVYMR